MSQVRLISRTGTSALVFEGLWCNNLVAIKELRESLTEGNPEILYEEIRTMKKLNHPNIVRLYGVKGAVPALGITQAASLASFNINTYA